ncbi:Uncharacterised protein [Vibrio cholerae]|nr:Uncharacterised protein [Vibrio cholerae]
MPSEVFVAVEKSSFSSNECAGSSKGKVSTRGALGSTISSGTVATG